MPGFYLTLFAIIFLVGCGADNLTDSTARKKDIERESAVQMSKDYEQIAGEYVSDRTDSEQEVSAYLQVIRVPLDGKSVPQPMITGNLVIKESAEPAVATTPRAHSALLRLKIGNTQDPQPDSDTVIAFSNGVYDPASRDLAFRVSGFTAPGANVSCKVRLPKIKCNWIPVGSGQRFHFSLIKAT